jgi:hypothetical protein
MTRRQKPAVKRRKAGVLMGMRHGVQKVAGSVVGSDEAEEKAAEPKSRWSKVWSAAGNIVSLALLVAALAIFLRRCGVVKF